MLHKVVLNPALWLQYLQVCDERHSAVDGCSPYKVVILDVFCVLIRKVDHQVHVFILDQSAT